MGFKQYYLVNNLSEIIPKCLVSLLDCCDLFMENVKKIIYLFIILEKYSDQRKMHLIKILHNSKEIVNSIEKHV